MPNGPAKSKRLYVRKLSTVQFLESRGFFGDGASKDIYLDAAEYWYRITEACNPSPGVSAIKPRDRIDDRAAYARVQEYIDNRTDFAQQARRIRAAAMNLAKILDLVIVHELSIKEIAQREFGKSDRPTDEKVRGQFLQSLDWVVSFKKFLSTSKSHNLVGAPK